MEIRKVVAGTVMGGLLSAGALGLAGSASATPFHYQPPAKPSITVQAQKVVVKSNGQVGNGNTQQTASGNAGAISNPQLGLAANVGLQVPVQLSVSPNILAQKGVGSSADQDSKFRQSATANVSNNSTVVNNSTDNGNGSSTNIGSQR